MPWHSELPEGNESSPVFEGLEARLLLTTIRGGEFFIFHTSMDETVRLTLNGPGTDAIEVFAHRDGVGLTDMPGLLNGSTVVGWTDVDMPLTATELMRPDDPFAAEPNYTHVQDNDGMWVEYGDRLSTGNSDPNDIDTWERPLTRSSRSEIFAIYVVECSPTTRLTISTLTGPPFKGNWMGNVNPWDSTNLPLLIEDPVIRSPAGSGGVWVGAIHIPRNREPDKHIEVNMSTVMDAPLMGVFAGGPVSAGITVSDSIFRLATPLPIGKDVHSVAAMDNGRIYAVDNGPFLGEVVNADDAGDLGEGIHGIAMNAAGEKYVVTNSRTPIVLDSEDMVGGSVPALAVNSAGIFYAIDDTAHNLMRIDPTDDFANRVSEVGRIVDSANQNHYFEAFSGLDFHTGTLWGVANRGGQGLSEEEEGKFVVTVSTVAVDRKVEVIARAKLQRGGQDPPDIGAVVWDPTGNTLYAVTSSNELVIIDATSGDITNNPAGKDLRLPGAVPMSAIVGLDYIGSTMYGIAADGNMYIINPASPGNCTEIGSAGATGMGSLAYDPTRPQRLYTVLYSNGLRLAAIPVWSSLLDVDDSGVGTYVGLLADDINDNYAFRDITAMEFDTLASLYATGTVVDLANGSNPVGANQWLIQIDPASGTTHRVAQLSGGPSALTTLAFVDSTPDYFYGVDPATNLLWTINPLTAGGTSSQLLDTAGIVGLEMVDVGDGTQMLLGVTTTSVFHVNPTTGACTPAGTGWDTTLTGLSGLTYDPSQPGVFYATNQADPAEGYRLATIRLSSAVTYTDGTNTVVTISHLFDYDEVGVQFNRTFAYTDVHALDYNATDGFLYAVATVVSLDPAGTPAPGAKQLVRIDPDYGRVVRLGDLDPAVTDLSTLAFDDLGVLYGVDSGTDDLVTIDTTIVPGTATVVAPLTVSGIIGMDFLGGVLYAATGAHLYTISTLTGMCTPIEDGVLTGAVTGFSTNPLLANSFWATTQFGGDYYLVRTFAGAGLAVQDIGRIIVGGTVAGDLTNSGNVELIRMGFLWGNVNVGKNLQTLVMEQGGGHVGIWTPMLSRVDVGGTLDYVHIRGGDTSTAFQVENEAEAPVPATAISELEIDVVNMNAWRAGWIAGDLVFSNGVGYGNSDMEHAQFLNHPTGTLTFSGFVSVFEGPGQLPSPTPHEINQPDPGPLGSQLVDWYAVPLMAGETMTLQDPLGIGSLPVLLYDSAGNWMDSYGYETIEDLGIASRGWTLKPMEFTAMEAGTYYLAVVGGGMYEFEIIKTNGGASLGGINVNGSYGGGFTGTGEASFDNIAVKGGGAFGSMVVSGGGSASLHTIGGGDFFCFQVGSGSGSILSEGSKVGRVASMTGGLGINVTSGAIPGGAQTPLFNAAPIQNISCAGTLGGFGAFASGSIGTIEVGGSMGGVEIFANYDHEIRTNPAHMYYDPGYDPGPAGNISQVRVVGDYGGLLIGVPVLKRGPDGDVGYVSVDGDIYVVQWGKVLLREPTKIHSGASRKLYDDSGGELTVSPVVTPELDANGDPVLDVDGNPVMYTPTYSYNVVGVDDDYYPTHGDGGAIVHLTIDGSAQLTAQGPVQIGQIDLSYSATGGPATPTLRELGISGNQPVDVYYVTSDGPLDAISNSTTGRLVCADLQTVNSISLGGSIGIVMDDAGGWIHGHTTAPASTDLQAEPQYGYFHGKINGLNVTGDLPSLTLGGGLGDLRATGTIGTVRVNVDRTRPAGQWQGVSGLVWSATRIDSIAVGDGLADDGPSDRAIAAILSGGSIGQVSISGPRYEVNGVVYGELNGSIFGYVNDFVPVTDPDGNVVLQERDSLGQIIGTNSAHLTALVGGMSLDSFKCFGSTYTTSGGVGTISMSGPNAQIYGSEITGFYVRGVVVQRDVTSPVVGASYGLEYVFIHGEYAPPDQMAVGRVAAGGEGMYYVTVNANGGDIGTVEGLGAVADISTSTFISTDGLRTMRARDIFYIDVHAPGTFGSLTATRDITNVSLLTDPGLWVGALGSVSVGRDFDNNYFLIAGELGRMTVGGAFTNSELELRGGAANLVSLQVTGNIEGTITSAGRIGSIISRQGLIDAEIATRMVAGATNADIALIRAPLGFAGTLSVAGSLRQFDCYADLGDPVTPQTFEILGNLESLRVIGTPADRTPDLYANFNVGGDVKRVDVDGDYYSEMIVLGNMDYFTIDGSLAGGSLDVYGEIGRMRFSRIGDLVADITSGASIQRLSIVNGDVLGNIESRFGQVQGVLVTNGNIVGNITGRSIRDIRATARDPGTGNITGDIHATNGGIRYVLVTGGNLTANVTATNGRIETLYVRNGNLGDAAQDSTVSATGGIRRLYVSGGDLLANIASGGVIDVLSVRSDVTGAFISSEGGIKRFDVLGNVTASTVRSATGIDRVYIRGNLADSTISSGWNVGTVNIYGNMVNSYLLAGYDTGGDAVSVLMGNGDGTFAEELVYPFGDGPRAVAVGDLDGANDLDLVVANQAANTVTVLLSDGLGGYTATDYDVGSGPVAVAVGDLDGANELDLVVANEGDDTVSVLLSDGAGGYNRTDVAVQDAPASVAIGDLDGGTNDLDLVVANAGADNSISVLLSDGAGGYVRTDIVVGTDPTAVAIGDLDAGTNDLDLAVANRTDATVSVLLSDGAGGYTATPYAVGTGPVGVAIADLDGLNELDVVTLNQDGESVSVLLADGLGAYAAHVAYPAGGAPSAMALGDLDGLNGPDVVVANATDNTVSILLNSGDGTFLLTGTNTVWDSPQAVAVEDLDADGNPDVIVVADAGGDNAINNGAVHSANIRSVMIVGDFDASVVAAGMAPGPDRSYVQRADNVEALGASTITRMTVRGNLLNPASSAVVADTAIDARFLTRARAEGVSVPADAEFITTVLNGLGDDFGPDSASGERSWQGAGGLMTITLNSGRANYDELTGTLTLEQTTSRSALYIRYTGTVPYGTITIVGSEDSALSALTVRGDVTIGTVAIDGPVRSLVVGEVADNETWLLPGGARVVRIRDDGVNNFTVTAGEVTTWLQLGAYASGSFQADAVRTFRVRGNAGADVSTTFGSLYVFMVDGDYSGAMTAFAGTRTAYVRGSLPVGASIEVLCGDLTVMRIGNGLVGTVSVPNGEVRSVVITGGDFGGDPTTAFRTGGGVGVFNVSRGDFSGLLSTEGDVRVVYVRRGQFSGKIRAAGSIQTGLFGSMYYGFAAAGNDFRVLRVIDDMTASWVFAGFDPGDAGYDAANGGEQHNVEIDAFTLLAGGTVHEGNADRPLGGSIRSVVIGGDMSPEYDPILMTWVGAGSTISAGLAPGIDGYVGTPDDQVKGAGYIQRVIVRGWIFGNARGALGESYGVYAANVTPDVRFLGRYEFQQDNNAKVGTAPTTMGSLTIKNVSVQLKSISLTFNHAIDFSTLNTAWIDPLSPVSLTLLVNTEADWSGIETDVTATVAHTLTYDATNYVVTLTLDAPGTWNNIGLGKYYRLIVEGALVRDNRGTRLDGDGDGSPGGQFVYEYPYGQKVLDVPVYQNWHGDAPSGAAMILGYYDGDPAYTNLMPGSSLYMTTAIRDAIASAEHISQYALYNGVDDSAGPVEPDVSDPFVRLVTGEVQHADNCLADLMFTSQSYVDGGALSLLYGQTDFSKIENAVVTHIANAGYGASFIVTSLADIGWGATFDWEDYLDEIDANRPVLFRVDTDLNGMGDSYVVGVGYNVATQRYAAYDIDPAATTLQWYDYTTGGFADHSITDAVLVEAI